MRGTLPIPPDQLSRVYAAYEELRRDRHLVDFESVLELTAAILAEHPRGGGRGPGPVPLLRGR